MQFTNYKLFTNKSNVDATLRRLFHKILHFDITQPINTIINTLVLYIINISKYVSEGSSISNHNTNYRFNVDRTRSVMLLIFVWYEQYHWWTRHQSVSNIIDRVWSYESVDLCVKWSHIISSVCWWVLKRADMCPVLCKVHKTTLMMPICRKRI